MFLKLNNIIAQTYLYTLGGPLTFFNETTSSYGLIGTVSGNGYEDKHNDMKGEQHWNKVSFHVPWIKETMMSHGDFFCQNYK